MRVLAHASDGHWWDAKVVDNGGKGKNLWTEVKFDGWRARYNETFKDVDKAIRARRALAHETCARLHSHFHRSTPPWPLHALRSPHKIPFVRNNI